MKMLGLFSKTKQSLRGDGMGQSSVIYQYCSEQGQITLYGVKEDLRWHKTSGNSLHKQV